MVTYFYLLLWSIFITINANAEQSKIMKIFLGGDAMLGRGIDQILVHPSSPEIYESYVKDARAYVAMAESSNGMIPKKAPDSYIWGDALLEWEKQKPMLKILNLETSVTRNNDYWKGKGINYRMNPENIGVLKTVPNLVLALANNHVMDWGMAGLLETLEVLTKSGIPFSGAGENLSQAMAPAIYNLNIHQRILYFSMGLESSGIPGPWRADKNRSGIYLLTDLSRKSLLEVKEVIDHYKRPGDLVIVGLHWGSNWGYEVPKSHQDFAHALIDEVGVHLIHGHSSHHPRPIEIYKKVPILYGCGDFINDYEGIGGSESFRDDLAAMYFVKFNTETFKSEGVEIVPMQIKKFKLFYAKKNDVSWMMETLARESKKMGTNFKRIDDQRFSAF